MSQSSQSSSPTGAALATASHLAARPVPAIAAVPPSSSSSSSTAAGAGVSGVSKTADVDVDVSTGSTSAPLAAAGDGAATTRPGVGPRQNSKKELMESAHLLCSLFGGGGAGGGSGSGGSTSPPRRAAGADEAVPPPAALVRHRSKGPLKKRMLMPVFDDADDDDDSDKDEGHGHGSAATRAKEEDGPTGLKTAVVAAVATQRQSQQQKETSTAASSASALTTGTTGATGTTGTPTGDYCTVLYTPGEDELYLSPQLCLTRAQIEAFEARPADVSSRRSAGGRSISRTLTVGQVGLRCIHCKHLTLRDRSMSAVHYPGSIRLVYQSVRNFQRNHFLQCRAMPQSVKDEFQTTRSRFVQSKGRSHVYWAKSCAEKGMVDTPDGGIRFNVDAAGAVVPADPDSAVEATEAFMAQNASRGPAARKRKAERDGSNGSNGGSTTSSGEDDSGGSGGKSTNKTGKDKTTERKKKKKKRASKKTVAAAPAAAVAARGTAAGAASDRTGVTVTATAEVGIAAKPSAAEPTKGKEESPYATAVLVPPSALAVTAAAPGPAPTALVAASSASSANPSVEGVVVAPPAPALTAQVSLDAEQLLRRQLQEYQQQQQQQFSSQPGQTAAHPGQESALAQADRIIRASLLEQEQQRQRQLLAAQLSGQYHPQHLQQLPLTYNPAPSPTLAAASAPAGAAASSAASLLRQQQQQEEIAASLGLGLPESAATAATAAMQKQQQQQQQIPAAASASSSPGATANAATRAEYLVYLETLDRMSASINAAQNLQAAYRTNPTVVGRLQYLAANDEMAAHMHRAKIQAMNLQRIRLESRLSDLNASLCVALQGGGAHAAPALAAAGAGVGAGAGASAETLSPNSLLRQVSE